MKIKTKLNLGVGLLFLIIIILSLVASFYVFSIKKDSENILKANYNTLEYSQNMLLYLDEMNADKEKAIVVFETNLIKQIANITEAGEDNATYNLKKVFNFLKKNKTDETLKSQIRQDIFEIMKLNMNAINQKNQYCRTHDIDG